MQSENSGNNLVTKKQKPRKLGLWIGLITIIGLGILLIKINKVELPDFSDEKVVAVSVSSKTKVYTQALDKYKQNRIEFDQLCQAEPKYAVFKSGSEVMLDNKSSLTRSIVFNSTRYEIEPFSFLVVQTNITKTFFVDCDKVQNVATINVQV